LTLKELGWNSHFESAFEVYKAQALLPARVAGANRDIYLLYTDRGNLWAEPSGRLRYTAVVEADLPSVGDWVAAETAASSERAVVHGVLPRINVLSRKMINAGGRGNKKFGQTEEQIVSANIDTIIVILGMDRRPNPRLVERFLALAGRCGSQTVLVLNKSDLCADVEEYAAAINRVRAGAPMHVLSAIRDDPAGPLEPYLQTGRTLTFIGASGVGKSTIINALLGAERQRVEEVRGGDYRGRHTTSAREMVLLPNGGIVIDNPGMRDIQLWLEEEDLQETFRDIEELADACRFRDCEHGDEPGCAVRQAIEEGILAADRFANYLTLREETRRLALAKAGKARAASKQWGRQMHKWRKTNPNPKHAR
jgi:ribosome biogenesis GTPase